MGADEWMDARVVVSHWPPPKPERPVKLAPSKRPLTGLPAMMYDLLDAADRHDRLKRDSGSDADAPCCPGHGTMAHVRGCANHPEAGR